LYHTLVCGRTCPAETVAHLRTECTRRVNRHLILFPSRTITLKASMDASMGDVEGNAAETTAGRVTRKYQQEMLEESVRRNIIIVLDTGSGKTHIAILRIRLEIERQLAAGSNKTCWFLVPTVRIYKPLFASSSCSDHAQVALCIQQTAVFQEHLPYQVDSITGAKQPDKWTSHSLWRDIVANNHVVVSTAQVLLDALRHGQYQRSACCC
jgi:ERCC4-related helicase